MHPTTGGVLRAAMLLIGIVACKRPTDNGVPFGPGPVLAPAAVTAAIGEVRTISVGWAANTPAPAVMRVSWAVRDSAVATIDSVSRDTRTAYIRARGHGATAVLVTESTIGFKGAASFTVP